MIKTKQTQKQIAFFALIAVGLSLLFIGIIFAQDIPQNIGFKDVMFSDLNKESCAQCHGDNAVDTHHDTEPASSGNCVLCHSVSSQAGKPGVSLQRDCMACHDESPHHATEAAENKECTSCHDSLGLSEYSMEVPPYEPSKVTPKPSDCRVCHSDGTVDGKKAPRVKDTHHEIKTCNICHDQLVLSSEEANDDKGVNIRSCQRCHNVKVLHEVGPHVEKENCAVCHGGKKAVAAQPEAEAAPEQ